MADSVFAHHWLPFCIHKANGANYSLQIRATLAPSILDFLLQTAGSKVRETKKIFSQRVQNKEELNL